jgi:thioredoxin
MDDDEQVLQSEVAEESRKRLKVVKVNVEHEPQIARQWGVRSQPTLMLFKHGSVEAQKVGALSKPQLKAFIDLNL